MMSQAFYLMVMGMITVFVILSLVVIVGKLLIRLVNFFTPPSKSTPDPEVVAALTAAVEVFTEGKGRIIRIEKHQT
jgi:oxaloacetate decarboxylase gamma subunit